MLYEDEGTTTEAGYVVRVPVRWSDMDVFAHINHARMVTLLEEARIPWLFYDERPTAALREGCVVADLHVRYREQVRHDEGPIVVTMFVEQLRAVDFTVGYEVRRGTDGPDAKPAVTATTQLVAFDVDAQRLRRLTAAEKAHLGSFRRDHQVNR
ncbi:acyl-CoA thioesterase [Gordonia sp. HNM0687]|uniref:Acyl-CoA thioesterase n=1 Tax=Gordonia mangrovi TaxID=2665643 RepID=A0A6L7GSZ3_9ACTN|nr:acyl-CoA thioesterase [Gordonia mangrovi]MDY6808747.1 acyl-CoA thioesterase [Actinomycetota bacterium]MXP22557.1 acyl-CoA thioesterase [Gordonia mangrovi]UVF77572.1 acyl-CoA thioesterase [Gordonia mangrovi]